MTSVRLLIERHGRSDHAVTVVWDLPLDRAELGELCRSLRRSCASGGRVVDDRIELQGDQSVPIKRWLEARGWRVVGP